jgi:hypothetical protein
LGKQMRAAVLTLSDHLALSSPSPRRGATTTRRWCLKGPLLVVNGVTTDRRDDVAGEMAHFRLTREQLTASVRPEQVTVSGVE